MHSIFPMKAEIMVHVDDICYQLPTSYLHSTLNKGILAQITTPNYSGCPGLVVISVDHAVTISVQM